MGVLLLFSGFVLATGSAAGAGLTQPAACQAGYSSPTVAARDLAAFQQALRAAGSAMQSISATAVHGHEVDITDASIEVGSPETMNYYREGPDAISDRLRNLWNQTYRALHPDDPDRDITTLQVHDRAGKFVIGISMQQCIMP
jgi:hypothetical protein